MKLTNNSDMLYNKRSYNEKNDVNHLCREEKRSKTEQNGAEIFSKKNPIFENENSKLCRNTPENEELNKKTQNLKNVKSIRKVSGIFNEYICEKCNYYTNYKSNYVKHCKTTKHIEKHDEKHKTHFFCENCKKTYKFKRNLIRHKKKCITENIENTADSMNTNELKNMFLTIMEENKELQNKLIEIAKEPKIINNNVMHNKQFNIITFLNDDCKDAFNLTEFIDNLKITFDDLQYIEKHGYIQGIKDSLVRSLAQMEQTKRPIHCTDTKRRQFYVKDNDEWDKDAHNNKINDAIKMYNTVQLKTLLDWKNDPSLCGDENSHERLNQLLYEVTSMYHEDHGDKIRNKIVNEIGNVTTIEK